MSCPTAKKPLDWCEIGVLAMLGGLVVLGLAANGLSLVQSLVALSFGIGVLLLAWLWQVTRRRMQTAPLTRWQRAWNAAVFLVWLAVMGALVWWCVAKRGERGQKGRSPSLTRSIHPDDGSADTDANEGR